ncbi:transglutaminase family protein [Paraconexibacter antarcticus]|uniref:Transglutaminase family protein n=1 Tax=Paraconexibacter antarcticus TaxID=2949664 RepID=A0ABY5DT64_9ACTN|nr:transglutaminase family protein [Paraconexibacter antarcticus]UTI63870.1 transglutaminase family protein [Paraconexibacter antarcticus]
MSTVADTSEDLTPYLQPGLSVDSAHPAVVAFAREHTAGIDDPREQAVTLYYAVRDGFRYDPYTLDLTPAGFRASTVLERGAGYCVPKAALLAAAARVVGIPSRVGFADVRNHLSSPKLLALMGTDRFVYHGYTELLLDGRWVKATPAFNRSLCEKTHTKPLEFDGREDSLLQPLDVDGRRHMEYLVDHGAYPDVPVDQMKQALFAAYDYLKAAGDQPGQGAADGDGAEAFERDASAPGA